MARKKNPYTIFGQYKGGNVKTRVEYPEQAVRYLTFHGLSRKDAEEIVGAGEGKAASRISNFYVREDNFLPHRFPKEEVVYPESRPGKRRLFIPNPGLRVGARFGKFKIVGIHDGKVVVAHGERGDGVEMLAVKASSAAELRRALRRRLS